MNKNRVKVVGEIDKDIIDFYSLKKINDLVKKVFMF